MFPLLNPSAPQLVCSNYEVVAVSNNEQYEIDKIYTLNAFAGYALQAYLQICVCPLKA